MAERIDAASNGFYPRVFVAQNTQAPSCYGDLAGPQQSTYDAATVDAHIMYHEQELVEWRRMEIAMSQFRPHPQPRKDEFGVARSSTDLVMSEVPGNGSFDVGGIPPEADMLPHLAMTAGGHSVWSQVHAAGGPPPNQSSAKAVDHGRLEHDLANQRPTDEYLPGGGISTAQGMHSCFNVAPPMSVHSSQAGGGPSPVPQNSKKKHSDGWLAGIVRGLGITGDLDEDELSKKVSSKIETLKTEKWKLTDQISGLKNENEGLRKDLENMKSGNSSSMTQLEQERQKLKASNERAATAARAKEDQIAILFTKVAEYKSIAEKFQMQLTSLEQSNSKSVGGTGAHKDSHAIPPNLLKSVEEVKLAASVFNKTFIGFLKERKTYDNHVALQSLPPDADERYRRHAFQAFVCSRLFAGFENDRYMDSPDYWHNVEPYLLTYEENDFILQKYDVESRHQEYLAEYEELLQKGLSVVMEEFKVNQTERNAFSRFCCRKLISIVGLHVLSEEFSRADNSKKSLIHQLTTNPKYGDKFVKPFVKLAITAFLLHRLAFQFNPPARTIRCARGAKFDSTYMDKAVPTDDDDSDENFVVGLMLVPGFQVGATIVKCTAFLVPTRSPATASGP